MLQHLSGFTESTIGGGISSIVAMSIATGCVFLLLITVPHYIMKKRRGVRRRPAGKSAHRNPTKISADG